MGISPMHVGDLYPPLTPATIDDNDQPFNLENVIFEALLLKNRLTGAVKTGQGTFLVTNSVDGIFQYAWDAADTDTAGEYDLEIKMTKDGLPVARDDIYLEILP